MKLLLRWIILAVSVIGASYFVQVFKLGFEATFGLPLFLGVAVLALLNATVGNFLKFLTIPLNCLTLGLLSLVINALVLIWAASLGWGFRFTEAGFSRFVAAFVAAIVISAINGFLTGILIKDDDREDKR